VTSPPSPFYFSFVTQTTLGYGDVKPLGRTRLVAAVQVFIGVLLVTLILARAVSDVGRGTLHYLSNCLSSRIKMVQHTQRSEARMARVTSVVREWPPTSGVRWRSSLNY